MESDDVYDVPPPRPSPDPEAPPSLPPKKSSMRSSTFRELDALPSQKSPDSRPKPMPRRNVRKSVHLGENEGLPNDVTSPTSPPDQSPGDTPKPTPRPRPRKHSLKERSDQPLSMFKGDEGLPPSADEVERMVTEMVMKEQEEEEEKQKQQHQQNALSQSKVGGGDAVSNGKWYERKFSDSFSHEAGKAGFLPQGVLSTDMDEVTKTQDDSYYENSDSMNKALALEKPEAPPSEPSSQTNVSGHGYDDGFDSAFGGSDTYEDYAKIQKPRDVGSSEFVSSFDPFKTFQSNRAHVPAALQPSVLQPMQVWDSSGELASTSLDTGGAGESAVSSVTEDTGSRKSAGQRDSDPYEALWFTKAAKEDRPGMVRPQSDLMAFTPKPQAEGGHPPPCEPMYGERSGEYIGLDPTYNIPPPHTAPPPLPAETVVRNRPPSIPPRPAHKILTDPATSFVFPQSSHLSESSTEDTLPGELHSTPFEGLPTPGFSSPFHDDPFKYSDFDTECQMFNNPSASDGALASIATNEDSSIYEIEDTPSADFVAEWPTNFSSVAGSDSTYSEIDAQTRSSSPLSRSSNESFRLSHVPPPPPRPRRGQGAVSREMPGTGIGRTNVYSYAQNDDAELSRSIDSSDSSEDLFSMTPSCSYQDSQRASDSLAGAKIISSVAPRKNERYGYLYKQGGVRANRGWRLRWVVFNGKDLRYYDSNRSQISKKIIPLSSMKEVISDIKEGDTNRFKFRLVTTLRDRTFLFAADTRDDCCTWTSTLMAAILENNNDQTADEMENGQPDKEGFIVFENNTKKKFYVAIWGKTLCYYDSFEDFQMRCPVHEIDMKLSSVKDKKKNRLQLSTHYAHFFLVLDSQQEAQSWRMAIEDAIAEGLADDSVLEKVYENDSNRICADCEDDNPHWASINLGIVLCKKCAGIHRMFDSSISKIRSLRMDTRVWTPSLIELMKAMGNGNANIFWEHGLSPSEKPTKDSLAEERKQFAQLKYQKRDYSKKHPHADSRKRLNEALLHAAAEGDLQEALRIIFSGADLSYKGGPEQENAYQTAKRHGQRLLMELLYQNGGDCSSLDEDSANNEGRLREDVRLQGYLLKTGPVGRTFDQRWCVLEHGALTYYLNDRSTIAKDSIDRKAILCLQEVPSERPESVFEISTSKGSNRVYTFAAESPSDRGMWMRTLGKLISPVAVMEHVGMMDFGLAALVFMRESVSEDWRATWIMLTWRLLNYMNKDLKLDHVDLRKATQIRMQDPQSGSCPLCIEKGGCFVVSSPGQTFYIQANLQRDTKSILDAVTIAMKQSGKSLLDQQLSQDNIPVILDRCLKQVDTRGQQEEGIYRKAATNSRVDKLIQELKTDAHAVRLDTHDIHEVANALKRFLRELDDSLFMRERYSEWIRTSAIEDHQNKFLWYRYLLEKLPQVNYNTLRRIILHISKLAEHEQQNKMSGQGLCTCFAPTLMRTENDTMRGNNPGHEIKVMLDLLSQRDYLFQIEQQELEHEDKIKKAQDKIKRAQQDIQRQSQSSSNFLMPVSMYNHNGQCEMVNTNPATTAKGVVDYLARKCGLSGGSLALSEILAKGALKRPLFPSDNILLTTGRWGDWDENVRKETCLCLTDTEVLQKLERHHDTSKPLIAELRYADAKSKNKFRKTTLEFKQYVLTFYKDSKAKNQLCSWKVEELTIYLGIDPKRSPPTGFGFTFLVNSREDKSKNSNFGHCVCVASEEEMYRWVAALIVAQRPEGLMIWNTPMRT